jgi:cell division topological specificity factor
VNVFSFLRPIKSARVAFQRLHTVLEYDRRLIEQTDLIPVLHTDILAAISRHLTVDSDKVQVRIDRSVTVSRLTLDVEIPNSALVGT